MARTLPKWGNLMLKKMILAGGAVALLSGIGLGVPISSHARCGTNLIKETANNAMPLEWEINRARHMIASLKPEVAKNARRIATEKVELARLQDRLDQTNTQLAKSETDIERLRDDLEAKKDYYTYAGRTYTSVQVQSDLGNRFKRFKTRQATAEKLDQMIVARQKSLQAARGQMDAMLNARRQLEVEVENLQARLGSLRMAQTSSNFNLDDSRLSYTRKLLDKIGRGIDMAEETMVVDGEYFDEIDLDQADNADLLDEISAYFGSSSEIDRDREAFVSIQLN
jgi:septal ring factor EnvC (AmiA/AmiB activator)